MKRKNGRTAPQPWTPFVEVPITDKMRAQLRDGGDPQWDDPNTHLVVNNRYTVWLRWCRIAQDAPHFAGERVIHLSIKRNDKGTLRDWRHLQRIKNELVGAEVEAVELFPADSRLVDEANQYHLWCFMDSDFRFVGVATRLVGGPEEAAAVGAKQRPFEVTP